MAELKTKQHDGSVEDFLNSVEDEQKRKDAYALLEIFEDITGEKAKMWGSSIVGFGKYHYKSERSRQEGDWLITGFSPRKQALTLYIMPGFERYEEYMRQLGKYKTGKGCLYVKKLADVDPGVLERLVGDSFGYMKEKYSAK